MQIIDVIDEKSSTQYNKLVKNKPTLVQYFSPHCHYCKQLESQWDTFIKRMKANYDGNIMIARVRNDMMDNCEGDKDIKGFPTIFILEKGKKTKEYEGDRSADDILKFVKENFKIQAKKQKGGRRKKRRRRKTIREKKNETPKKI